MNGAVVASFFLDCWVGWVMSLFADEFSQSVSEHADGSQVWQQCLADLQMELQEKDYRQWITPLRPQLDDGVLILLAPNAIFVNHVNSYLARIKALVTAYGQGAISDVRVEMVVSTTPSTKVKPKAAARTKTSTAVVESLSIDPTFTFDGFVKGRANQDAYNACNELSKKDSKYNYGPIFIYGSSGLGKTHLMHAMAHRYQKYGKSFFYFTKEHFYSTTLKAVVNDKIDKFKKEICAADLLIIDDMHMYDGKKAPKVTEILMTLFEHFSQPGKQVVMASNRPPSQMTNFDDRSISRLSGGLSLAILPPDMEMRVQILEKKASLLQIDLPRDCAIFMAQNLPPDVRGLEGALKNVRMSADLKGVPVTMALVRDAIRDQVQSRARALNAESIRDLVAEFYEISPKDLMGKKRARNIARPRQMAMALIREVTRDSFPEIGQVFGGRDHTTVMHACEKIEELKMTDPSIETDYHKLKMMLEYA